MESDNSVPTTLAPSLAPSLVDQYPYALSPSARRLPTEKLTEESDRDSFTTTAFAEVLDRATHALMAKMTLGLSPASLIGAYLDWLTHLAASPGKRLQLSEKAYRKLMKLHQFTLRCALGQNGAMPCIEPLPQDSRFSSPLWRQWPFNVFYQSHLLAQQWWHVATTGVPGVSERHERMLQFTARQMLDVFSPSNFIATNPEVLRAAAEQNGMNFVRGFQNFVDDWERFIGGRMPAGTEAFEVGANLAITPGKVVYQNHLIELIQYSPTTDSVRPEPVFIVPAWIMKYYILDLSPQNSLIKHLVDAGFTVFAISWRNPGPESRDLGMDDYRRNGVLAALDVIRAIIPDRDIHGVGYCLGGTLLAIAAAALSRDGKSRFRTLSFLAAQVDFSDPGELQLFINDSQLRFLEDMMWEQGFLDAKQMAGAFQMLRSNDLIWSRIMREYMLGERPQMTDMMAWNADSTRMPYRMHAEYLRKLYLNNDLVEGRFVVDGRPITIADIHVPIFCVGTEKDHIAPWRSVFKWHQFADTSVTFVLTKGGHNAGIVSEPGHPHRSFKLGVHNEGDLHQDPDTWAARAKEHQGSWWLAWESWLCGQSGSATSLPEMGAEQIGFGRPYEAPGTYVHEH